MGIATKDKEIWKLAHVLTGLRGVRVVLPEHEGLDQMLLSFFQIKVLTRIKLGSAKVWKKTAKPST